MAEEVDEKSLKFHEMGLDDRLLKAIAKLGWKEPTLIQEKMIPLALEGKDLLGHACTGSGKTAAFLIPVIQKILLKKQTAHVQAVRALILAPSKELCHQIHKEFLNLTTNCSRKIRCVDISGQQADLAIQHAFLVDKPDVVIGTPSRVLTHLKTHNFWLNKSMELLVIDEGDLLFSFGYENDIKAVLSYLPQIYQAILASATLNEDLQSLKQLVLHNPVILKLRGTELPSSSQLTQYHIMLNDKDKFVLLFALFKLKLINGKTIIFVNSVNNCYRLKLYLEQFGISSSVLNSEMPAASRWHILMQFNQGLYDIIIASDEWTLDKAQTEKIKSKRGKDKESGVVRGIDYQFVSNVINYDFPLDIKSYIHRVGRTARGNNQGTALSFVGVKEVPLLKKVDNYLGKCKPGEDYKSVFTPYHFKMEAIEGFQYRAKDAWQSVTKSAIREARYSEIKKEIMNSQKLKCYFEDNPQDLNVLRHDKALHKIKVQPHLKHVPKYLIPPKLRNMAGSSKINKERKRLRHGPSKHKKFQKMQDPLRSMKFLGFNKN